MVLREQHDSKSKFFVLDPPPRAPEKVHYLLTPLPGGSHAVRAVRRLQTLREPPGPTLSSVSWTRMFGGSRGKSGTKATLCSL